MKPCKHLLSKACVSWVCSTCHLSSPLPLPHCPDSKGIRFAKYSGVPREDGNPGNLSSGQVGEEASHGEGLARRPKV